MNVTSNYNENFSHKSHTLNTLSTISQIHMQSKMLEVLEFNDKYFSPNQITDIQLQIKIILTNILQ